MALCSALGSVILGMSRLGGQLLWSQRVSVGLWHFLSQTAIESIHSDLAPTDNIATVVSSCFFFFIKIYLFMAVLGLHFCVRAFSSCGKWGPLFITVRGPLIIALSLIADHRLQTRRLSNCGSQAQLLCDMWDPPRPGLEPVSPALAGRFSTTAPPGKPHLLLIIIYIHMYSLCA